MSRAMIAAAKSKIAVLFDTLHLDHDEMAAIGVAILIDHGQKAGLDRRGLLALVDDALAAKADEGVTQVGGAS